MRGEDFAQIVPRHGKPGSPPHARGRPKSRRAAHRRQGITPACAGKTFRGQRGLDHDGDHPRMRGEDMPSPFASPAAGGSPPHARGRLKSANTTKKERRITPACAGKTCPLTRNSISGQDHPRMRGEDGNLGVRRALLRGSPPHARGRRGGGCRARSIRRITPACAGKTTSTLS